MSHFDFAVRPLPTLFSSSRIRSARVSGGKWWGMFASSLVLSLHLGCSGVEQVETGPQKAHIGVPLDFNGDGIADVADFNNDNIYDGVLLDINGDGIADGVGIDADKDGYYEGIDVDLDGIDDSASLGLGSASSGSSMPGMTGGTGTNTGGTVVPGAGTNPVPGSGGTETVTPVVEPEEEGPVIMGYVYDWSEVSANVDIAQLPLQNVDYIVHAFVTADSAGNVVELEAFPHQRNGG
ncbi:MAG: hypothetical protein MK135_17635, partial [Polyangiaceae bacterium]|nr:hypothetical protein [Polyangiaceae bacterium]